MSFTNGLYEHMEDLENIASLYRVMQLSVIKDFTDEIDYIKDLDITLYNINKKLQCTIDEMWKVIKQSNIEL